MKIKNISGKVIGINNVVVLPGETKEIPSAYERSPILEVYRKTGMATIIGNAKTPKKSPEEVAKAKAEAEEAKAIEAEELRKKRLASVSKLSEEELATLAEELGINPAECKDQADVTKKVRAALKK